jgi:hypothetical protein
MGLQNGKSCNFENFKTFNLRVTGKMTLGCNLMASHKKYYMAEGDGFFQVQVVVSFVSLCTFVTCSCTKNVLTMH